MSKINKIFTILAISLLALTGNNLAPGEANVLDHAGESIQYILKPGGKVEYNNCGTVDLKGVKANLITLKSKILFFEITEKIFSDPESLLPYKTERTTSGFWSKAYRTEEYDQKKFTVVIRNIKGERLVNEQVIQANGPIENVNLVLFYLCKQPGLKIGRHFAAKVLDGFKLSEFDLKLLSIDEIIVPAGKFQTYHFKSTPDKYEIWISKDTPQVPIKIKLKSIVNYTMAMEKYNAR